MKGCIALICLCVGILFTSSVFGQLSRTDSLGQQLKKVRNKEKVDVLNQLAYEFISRDTDKVIRYVEEAIALSKEIKYLNGEARAFTYRGVNEYLTGRFSEAHRDLNKGLRLARKTGDRNLEGYILLQLGNCSLEEVRIDSAMIFFKRSYAIFKDSTDPVSLSKLYRNISALYGQRHKVDSQRIYLDRAIAIRKLLPDKELLAEGLLLKANITLRKGNFTEAETLIDEIKKVVGDQPEQVENRNDINHLEALILFQKGKFDEAVVLFDSARSYYLKTSLLRKYVTLLIDLGRVFYYRGEYELALNNLYDALKISKLQGFDVETAIIRNQMGWVNFHLGNMDQALELAEEALSLGAQRLLPADVADIYQLKGVVFTEKRKFSKAGVSLDSAVAIYQRLNDNRGLIETYLNLGYLESKRGNYTKALQHYKESIQMAERESYDFGLAWSLWGMGDAYFRQGDYDNATRFLNQSEEYARTVGLSKVLILNFTTRSELLAAQKRFEEALQYSTQVREMRDSVHRTDVTRRFLNLEQNQEIEERDRSIEGLQKDKLLAENKILLQEAKLKQQSLLIAGGVIGIGLLGILAFVYYRFYSRIKGLNKAITDRNSRIQTQSVKLKEVNVELARLYREVSEQKEKIQAQAEELTATNKNISDINRSLERLVEEKTHELRTTNEELVKHNGELLQFSYTVSHNLRGPVVRLMSLAELAMEENDLDKARQWIERIGQTTAELDTIIKDLSKILELRSKPYEYHEAVRLESEWNQSRSLLQDNLNGSEEIIANFEHLPAITTVRAMLQSIFYNLLSNAMKFRSPERNLRVVATSRVQDGKAILEIADNGIGLNTSQHKEKLFKLYKRFHTHVEGRGLGLYLIKSQIEVLRGTIEVESEPGRGTMFRVILPLMDEIDVEFRKQA